MKFLFTDETNVTPGPATKFFVYGGLIVDGDRFQDLHNGIARIRLEAGYGPNDEFKFDSRSRPEAVARDVFNDAKRKVIALCGSLQCTFVAYVFLHAIGRGKSVEELVKWGANSVIGKFNYYCSQLNASGVVVVDRLPAASEYRYLTDKFTNGLQFPEDPPVSLDRIVLFSASALGASHACSAMDIILGSFRYCINDPKNVQVAKEMMPGVVRLLWHERVGNTIYALEKGLVFRPKKVKVPAYEKEYSNLLAHISSLLAE